MKLYLGTVGEYELYEVVRDGRYIVAIYRKGASREEMFAKDEKTAREWANNH